MIPRPLRKSQASTYAAYQPPRSQSVEAAAGLLLTLRLWQTGQPMDLAPLCVPVEIALAAGDERCFRLALGISETGLRLRTPLPEEMWTRPLRIRLTLPHFLVAPSILESSDLAVVMPRRPALRFAARHALQVVEPDLGLPPFSVSFHWTWRAASDSGHQWLRSVVSGLSFAAERTLRARVRSSHKASLKSSSDRSRALIAHL